MLYNQPFGAATNAPFVNGNPSTGTAGSIPPAAAIENPQREIVNVISGAGLTPTNADLTQLAKGIQSNQLQYHADTGTADALVVTLPVVPSSLVAGMVVWFAKGSSGNATTTPTLQVNSFSPATLVRADGTALAKGELAAGVRAGAMFDGGNWRIVSYVPQSVKIISFLRGRAKFIATGAFTWTIPADVTVVTLKGWGAGAGGGFASNPGGAAGGGSGAYFEVTVPVAPGGTITGSVGSGGAAGSAGLNGGAGGATTITAEGTTYTAGGGSGGTNANANAVTNSASGGSVTGTVDISRGGEPSAGGLQGYNGTTTLYYGGKGGTGPANAGQPAGGGGGGGANGNVAGAGSRGEAWIEY
jgi:hypothetical protein